MSRKKMNIRQQQIGRMQMRIKYTKLPEDVKKAIVSMPYIVEETVKLTWDGRQFILRIPKEIAEEAGITAENQIKFKFIKFPPESNEKSKLEISVL
ncbi:MAG: hypothetical protein M1538_01480 [Candidatus Marsarchaeota archaeon]|nr:hypothetical protein [Candidatus Marsarchaeota archaeon]